MSKTPLSKVAKQYGAGFIDCANVKLENASNAKM